MNIRELEILKEHFKSEAELESAVERVEKGEPLAYVIGEWYFYGLTFKLNSACLIPRPDTEHVVETAIAFVPENGRIADLCCGSGCIAISVLAHRDDCMADAFDISEAACEMTRINAHLNGVDTRLNAVNADVFKLKLRKDYDAIISNPPYIRTDVIPTLDCSVKDYEPVIALDGGEDGMDFYRRILSAFRCSLNDGGRFIFEIGYDQGEQLKALANELGYSYCRVTKDYGGNDRVAVIGI